jgi:hypothetical protein
MSTEITLRDRIAIAALPALIERQEIAGQAHLTMDGGEVPEDTTAGWDEPDFWKDVACGAYALADAMIAERVEPV